MAKTKAETKEEIDAAVMREAVLGASLELIQRPACFGYSDDGQMEAFVADQPVDRWKRAPWTTLLLYGFHSHLQQIPIFFGQLQFLFNGKKALMEYKDISPLAEKPPAEKLETRQP